jgi:hypothetical protein
MLRALSPLLVVFLFASGCVVGIHRSRTDTTRGAIIECLQTHYCAEDEWPHGLDGLIGSRRCSREQKEGVTGAKHVLLFDAGRDRLVLMQDGIRRDTHLVTLLRRPQCNDAQRHVEGDEPVSWVSFALPREFTRISSSEPTGFDKDSSSTRQQKLFEVPGKRAVVIANLYGDRFSVSELEQLKVSYEKTFPRVFRNLEWIRTDLELKKGLPRSVFIFTADRLEETVDTSEDRWVFVTLAMLAGKQLFALEAAAPLSQQDTFEKLVDLVTDSLEFERTGL